MKNKRGGKANVVIINEVVDRMVVLRDTQEKKAWDWPSLEVEDLKIPTGDYTLKGLEETFIIERKASTSEFATNINEARFTRELERLSKFKHSFIVCEFSYTDVCIFPQNSGIPQHLWSGLRVTSSYMIKKINEFALDYGVKILFADSRYNAKRLALDLFKRMYERFKP